MKFSEKRKIHLVSELETRKDEYLKHRFTKYVVGYRVEDDKLKVLSNIGRYRYVSNTKVNEAKLNRIIIKNKLEIEKRIENYASLFRQRLLVLLFNCLIIMLAGGFTLLSFFIGNYMLFLGAIATFQLGIFATCASALNYYVSIKEIQNLKKAINYKKEARIELPSLKTELSN